MLTIKILIKQVASAKLKAINFSKSDRANCQTYVFVCVLRQEAHSRSVQTGQTSSSTFLFFYLQIQEATSVPNQSEAESVSFHLSLIVAVGIVVGYFGEFFSVEC